MTANSNTPQLVLMSGFGSKDEFLEFVFKTFLGDFVHNITKFRGQKIFLRKRPTGSINGVDYDWTFHHIITKENTRNNNIREFNQGRAERIQFPKFYVNQCQLLGSGFKIWSRSKNNEIKYYIADNSFDYLVILSQRRDYIMLLSAFLVETDNYKYKLNKEYEHYKNQPDNGNRPTTW